DADEGIVAAGFAQGVHELPRVGCRVRQPELQRELVIGHGLRSRLLFSKAQLSTTRRSCLAWFPGFLGVLQMLAMQNSPQRHVSSLYGHNIRPHACEPPSSIVHPCASA